MPSEMLMQPACLGDADVFPLLAAGRHSPGR